MKKLLFETKVKDGLFLLAMLGISPEEAHMVVVNGRSTRDVTTPLSDGDTVAIFPPVAGGMGLWVEIVECGPQPACASLDPGTRVKTHLVRAHDDDGGLLWERSLYSQYDTRQVLATPARVLVGYDDRVVALDLVDGRETASLRVFLFMAFWAAGSGRVLIQEKGSLILVSDRGEPLWEHGSGQILGGVLPHGPDHVFVHFWGGSVVHGLTVPFACLSLATGEVDGIGPDEAPDFMHLAPPEDVAGPADSAGLAVLRDNAFRLAQAHPSVWIRAMWEHVRG